MGLMDKISDKLSGKHKDEEQTPVGSDSTYGSNTTSGLTGSSTTGNDSSLRHPVSGNQTSGIGHSGTHTGSNPLSSSNQTSGLGHSGANTGYGSSTSNNPLSSNNQTSGLGHSGANTGYGSSTSNNPLSSNNQTSGLGHSSGSHNPISSNQTSGHGHSDANTGYGSSTSHNPLSSTTTTTNTTTGLGHSSGSHNPMSSTTGTHGTSGISSRDHVNRDGYGTEQHPSLRDNQTHGSVPGAYPGPAPNTAGPHKSDMLNKADPRVDSDQSKAHGHDNYPSGTSGTGGYGSHDTSRQGHSGHAQGFVPGSQAENPSAIPTAGGSKVGSDNDAYGSHSSSTRGNETSGPYKSDMMNKMDPRVDSDNSKLHDHNRNAYGSSGNTYGSSGNTIGSSGHHSTTAGPHGSDNLNRADPRVDSDNSRSQHHYGRDTAIGGAGAGAGAYGASHIGHNEPYSGSHNTAGPHSNDTFNRADPRVDSDNSRAYGTSGQHNTTAGPHSNNTLNKADPRVDSDNSRAYGRDNTIGGSSAGTGAYGSSHSGPNATSGPHYTDTANRVDPRVDSDNSRSHGYGSNEPYGSSTHGSSGLGSHGHNTSSDPYGSSAHSSSNTETAGPHKSNMLNKLDPRVDSDQSKLRRDNDLSRDTGNMSLNDRHTGNNSSTTSGGYGGSSNTGMSDITHGKKLGGAYEAGYQAALDHMEAQKRGN